MERLRRDQVVPRSLSLDGELVLHGGVVRTGDGAVAFLGDSGTGKSTLCASFGDAGYAVLTDDCFVVRPANEALHAVPVHTGLRLPDDVVDHFAGGDAPGPDPTGKHPFAPGGRFPFASAPAPLTRLFVLDPDPAECIAITPVSVPGAFTELIRNSFQLDLTDRARATAIFDTASRVVEELPVRRIRYPRRLCALDEVREAILSG